mmetsp:Transcript_64014/g.128489  ORF Transcript_64014/g.128489 Transcript_64014/m.128489 type:complete len:241 (+) Transcript_64014:114-836(+)
MAAAPASAAPPPAWSGRVSAAAQVFAACRVQRLVLAGTWTLPPLSSWILCALARDSLCLPRMMACSRCIRSSVVRSSATSLSWTLFSSLSLVTCCNSSRRPRSSASISAETSSLDRSRKALAWRMPSSACSSSSAVRCRKRSSSWKCSRSCRSDSASRLAARRSSQVSRSWCFASSSCLSSCCCWSARELRPSLWCWTCCSSCPLESRRALSSPSRLSTSRRSCRMTSRSAAITASKWAM